MPKKLSSLLGITGKNLEKRGVFDRYIEVDSKLHIDPSLLDTCDVPEFKDARAKFDKHFKNVLTLIIGGKKSNLLLRQAKKNLTFKEVRQTGLGYAAAGTQGSAIGPKLAGKILDTASEIVDAGVQDPTIFELVGILQEHIGPDRISDMTVRILVDNFAKYTERICKEVKASTKLMSFEGGKYNLPINPGTKEPILLVPKKLLRHLPLSMDWDDRDSVSAYNEALRKKVNDQIGENWKHATRTGKANLRNVLLDNPELFSDLIKQYKKKPRTPYDFQNDPMGEMLWGDLSENVATEFPINFAGIKKVTSGNIYTVVKTICQKFADLIENHAWFDYLYDHTGKQKPERASQLLFYGIADSYCEANDFDLNREINAGLGSLDFKISKGYTAKVNVELKLSSNSSLINGYKHQLPTYNKAEKTYHSIYLVIQTNDNNARINELLKVEADEKAKGRRVPEVVVIDGRKQVTASKKKAK